MEKLPTAGKHHLVSNYCFFAVTKKQNLYINHARQFENFMFPGREDEVKELQQFLNHHFQAGLYFETRLSPRRRTFFVQR